MLPSILKFAEDAAIIEERESNQFDLTYHPKLNDPIKIKWPRTIAENLICTSKLSINLERNILAIPKGLDHRSFTFQSHLTNTIFPDYILMESSSEVRWRVLKLLSTSTPIYVCLHRAHSSILLIQALIGKAGFN